MQLNATFLQGVETLAVREGLKDYEVAEKLGIRSDYFSRLKNGRVKVAPELQRKLDILLGGDPLLPWPDDTSAMQAKAWAEKCGLSVGQLAVRAVQRVGRQIADEIAADLGGMVPHQKPAANTLNPQVVAEVTGELEKSTAAESLRRGKSGKR